MKNLLAEANERGLIKDARRVGNSTRQVDLAIELLFSGEDVAVYDHAGFFHNPTPSNMLFDNIVRRLKIEHEHEYVYKKMFTINTVKRTITQNK